MGAVGFFLRAPRRHPWLAATLFVLVTAVGLAGPSALPRIHGARHLIWEGSVVVAVLVAFLGAAVMDWRAGLLLEAWQLRSLKIDVLVEFDGDLMRRVRAELSPEVLEEPPATAEGPQNALSLAPQNAMSAEAPSGMATADQVAGFRELRTRLLAIAAGRHSSPFTILVVPLMSGSGGSFVARNLAASFTYQDGASALLIDCNLTHPSQHLALHTSDALGLFDFLDEPNALVAPRPTGIHGLYLIPSRRPRSPSREYFSSIKMRRLLHVVRGSGRFVFLDGPPAKGSPDARILSELADFVVLVVGYGKGTAEDVAQAVAMFDPAKFAGVVFNERP